MPTITAVFQTCSLIGSVAAVALLLYLARRWPETRLMVVMPGLWALFGVVYYGLVLTGRFSPAALLLWGAVHRFLAVSLTIGFGVALWGIVRVPPLAEEERDRDA